MFEAIKNRLKIVAKLDETKLLKSALSDKDLQDEITRMNTQDQLYELGIDSKGNSLGEYSHATIYGTKKYEGKIQKGQRYDHITLSDTFRFYNSFKVKVQSDGGFVISAKTDKGGGDDLARNYGQDILGLTQENLGYVRMEVKKSITKEIRKKLS
jgi:hypothetical protein